MAKSQAQINLDYAKAIAQADELDRIARELKTLSNATLEQSLSQVASGWKGENAEAYIAKGRTLQKKIETSAKNLSETAKTIRSIAKRIRDADLAALAIAQSS